MDSSSEREPPPGSRLKMLGTSKAWLSGASSSEIAWVDPEVIAM
jgi:hypothetical protein